MAGLGGRSLPTQTLAVYAVARLAQQHRPNFRLVSVVGVTGTLQTMKSKRSKSARRVTARDGALRGGQLRLGTPYRNLGVTLLYL